MSGSNPSSSAGAQPKKGNVDVSLAHEEINSLKNLVQDKIIEIQSLSKEISENKDEYKNYRHLAIAVAYLRVVDYYLRMHNISSVKLGAKTETYINDARKNYFNALMEAEKVTTKFVDTTLSENQDTLETIPKFNPARKLALIRRFEELLQDIEKAYGKNSKWTPQLIEAEARYTVVLKNLIDYKEAAINDPRKAFFEQRTILSELVREKLRKASERYRDKYTLGNREVDDIRRAIDFQEALRKISMLFGLDTEAETCKKTVEAWNAMLEKDLKKRDDEKKYRAKSKTKPKKKK